MNRGIVRVAMFRKIAFALGATAVIGAAALTPTTASAWHHTMAIGTVASVWASVSLLQLPSMPPIATS